CAQVAYRKHLFW
nr:immunoglobulin heavy chain junction region [Macaca mulatta]MOY27015.1 immunoglobulin heavy chain junction region [Macaca mulatta]